MAVAEFNADGFGRLLADRDRRELELETFAPAAVLIPILTFDGPPRILLTVRSSHVEHHKNQISFPGGRVDEGESAPETALRETHEEVGIEPSRVRLIGAIDDIYTISNFRVTPLVGLVENPVRLDANPAEIAEIIEVPIRDLLDEAQHRREPGMWRQVQITLHFFYWKSHIIWGATGMILDQFLDLYRSEFL
ncbi:CoA pyrophosphatase [bacterium]|nr:CoA pyrophosphatase [bacterium]MCB9475593.1 CoA pyrophosphatase [Deltaproteobacteria bacterium]